MNRVLRKQVKSGAELENSPALGTVCDALGGVLSDGVDVHRCQAAQALGKIGSASSAHYLIKALLDEDEDVRTDAAGALLTLASVDACDQLLENLLGDPCAEVKLAAIDTLAKLRDKRVIPWLRRMIKGRDEEIVWDEDAFFQSGWDDWVEIQVHAIKALAEFQIEEAVPDIIAAIEDENAQDMTEVAFKALSKMGFDGVKAVSGYLNNSNPRLRRRAATVIAGIPSDIAKESLAQALADPAAEVRLATLKARSAAFADDPVLAGLLEDNSDIVRAKAVQLLGQHHRDIVLGMLDDPAAVVKSAALQAIAKFTELDVDDALIERLGREINSRAIDVSVAACATLASFAPDIALAELVKLLGKTNRPVPIRLGALAGLAAIGSDDAIEALVAVIDDDERQIRLEVMSALAKLASKDAQWPNIAGTALLAALRGEYTPEVEDTPAVEAETEAVEPEPGTEIDLEPAEEETVDIAEQFPTSTLDVMLQDIPGIGTAAGLPDDGIELSKNDIERLAIARRVVGKKKMAITPKVVKHEDIRRFAARVLGDIDQGDVMVELAAVLAEDDIETCLVAADSLARIGARKTEFNDDVTQVFLTKLSTDNRNLKLLLIRALGACDEATVSAQLRTYLSDADSFVRLEAVQALAGLAQAEVAFQGLLGDPDPSVRMAAATAYAQAAGHDAVERLVAFTCSFEGYHSRLTARLLRSVDADQASAAFLKILNDPAQRRVWSVAIEALEELNQHQEYASFS